MEELAGLGCFGLAVAVLVAIYPLVALGRIWYYSRLQVALPKFAIFCAVAHNESRLTSPCGPASARQPNCPRRSERNGVTRDRPNSLA